MTCSDAQPDPGAELGLGFLTSLLLTPSASHRVGRLHRLLIMEHNGIAIQGPAILQSSGIRYATCPSAWELSGSVIALITAFSPLSSRVDVHRALHRLCLLHAWKTLCPSLKIA